MNLSSVIEELVEDRGLDRETLNTIICEGMLAAYQRKYPELNLKSEYNATSGDVIVSAEKEVVATPTNQDAQISLKKAQSASKGVAIGDKIWVPFDGTIGRIEILRARQVISGKIRKVEAAAVYNEFKPKEGEIVHGSIHKVERGGAVVKLDDALAFLPKSYTIPGDKCIIGFPIRALLKEVLQEPRNDNQLILDRTSPEFLQKLFEIEIPEIYEKLVELKKLVRAPGYKSKIIVTSNDSNIDPVGTCVGVGGSRIKPILKEIGGEKIDVIPWSESRETLVKNALKPAQVDRVEVDEGVARVWLDEDQRALAIGRMGQNISLASKLVGIDIQLVQNEPRKDREEKGYEEEYSSLGGDDQEE